MTIHISVREGKARGVHLNLTDLDVNSPTEMTFRVIKFTKCLSQWGKGQGGDETFCDIYFVFFRIFEYALCFPPVTCQVFK